MTSTVLSLRAGETTPTTEGLLSLWRHDMPALSQITMANIAARIAEKYGLTVEELKGERRTDRIAQPRQEAMWEMMQTGKWSTSRVGMFLGDRDHTTVIYGARAHEKRATSSQCLAPPEGGILAG